MTRSLGRARAVRPVSIAVVALAAFLTIPLVTNTFQTFQMAQVAAFTIAIIGLNILTGYSGQISLGNGAFMAVGSYTTALLVSRLNWPVGLTVPLGGILAGAVGLTVGIPALRLRGIYLALATFALALSVTPVLNNFDAFTGGHIGVSMKPPKPPDWLQLSNEQWLYFLDWMILAIVSIPAWLLIRSRTGRAWMAIRDSETAAVANGISLAYYKTLAFGISAFYAGIAGSLLVINIAYANPDSYNLALSLSLLVGLVLGGLGYLWGPLIGGLLVVWLPYFAEKSFGQKPDVAFGALLIVVVFLAPNGVAGLIHRALLRLRPGATGELIGGALEATPVEAGQIKT